MKQYFQWIGILAIFLLTSMNQIEAKDHDVSNSYHVMRSDYTFSTVFDMATDKYPVGSVVKSSFHIKTHYDAYDRYGLYEGQGICRIFCLGLFYTWATEIDIYNGEGEYVGLIDGQMVSAEPAKFSFYDGAGRKVAVGYLDQNCMGFSLVDPENSSFVLARLTRNFILDTVDNWDVVIYYPEFIHPRLVKIFAAFVCDTQDKFKSDL